ncbi:MAG: hypothetical protein HND48_23420 [Chloroflexi bacterium]|nr:hypothetical protein [Chloroflexota bacterium]
MATSTMTRSAAAEIPGGGGGFRRRLLTVFGLGFLILFALIQTVPFVLTVSNSFKCLPGTRQAPEAFIPS